MNTNITNHNKTPSLQQPKERTKEQWYKIIENALSNNLLDEAIEIDEKNKVGYFAAKEKEAHKPHEVWLDRFITQDADMIRLKDKIRILVDVEDPVLILGESGTGKELLARALHGRKDKEKFIPFNCAGSTEHLIESELFGHEKGSFTGADRTTEGLFALAQDGTLFLDEVGELPLATQAKLLRVLQDKQLRKVGGKEWTTLNRCRVVAATHQDLREMVANKQFRLDLYFRLSRIELMTKPIRDRIADIPQIVRSLEQVEGEFPASFDWKTYAIKHEMRGNVRHIENLMRRYQLFKELPTY